MAEEAPSSGLVRHLPALVILVVAAVLRLNDLGLAEFKYDEAYTCVLATEIAQRGARPVVDGPTSLGIPGPAAALYFYALPRLLSPDPRALVAAVAVTNILAVVACYYFVRRAFGDRMALVANFLYAVNPWAILLGRKIWAHILPLLTVLALYCLYRAVIERKKLWVVPFLVLLALQGQFYPVAAFLAPGAALILILYWKRLDWRFVLMGLALGLAISFPYGQFLLAYRQGVAAGLARASAAGPSSQWWGALKLALWQTSGFGIQGLLGESEALFAPYIKLLGIFLVLAGALALAGLVMASRKALERGPQGDRYALIVLWGVCPLLVFTFWRFPLQLHYLAILYPVLFILPAFPLARLLEARGRLLPGVAMLALLGLGLGQANATLSLEGYLANYDGRGSFGLPLSYWQNVAAQADGLGGEILVASRGNDPRRYGIPAIFFCLLGPQRHPRYLDWRQERRALVLPKDAGVLVVPPQVGRLYTKEMDTFARGAKALVPGGSGGTAGRSTLYRLKATDLSSFLPPDATRREVHFANGIILQGYRLPTSLGPGERLGWDLYLAFGDLPPGAGARNYVFYNHLLDAEGQLRAQADGFGWAGRFWREGESALVHFERELPATLPPGEYTLRTGMYDLDSGERSSVLDAEGKAVADGVDLGRIQVR